MRSAAGPRKLLEQRRLAEPLRQSREAIGERPAVLPRRGQCAHYRQHGVARRQRRQRSTLAHNIRAGQEPAVRLPPADHALSVGAAPPPYPRSRRANRCASSAPLRAPGRRGRSRRCSLRAPPPRRRPGIPPPPFRRDRLRRSAPCRWMHRVAGDGRCRRRSRPRRPPGPPHPTGLGSPPTAGHRYSPCRSARRCRCAPPASHPRPATAASPPAGRARPRSADMPAAACRGAGRRRRSSHSEPGTPALRHRFQAATPPGCFSAPRESNADSAYGCAYSSARTLATARLMGSSCCLSNSPRAVLVL